MPYQPSFVFSFSEDFTPHKGSFYLEQAKCYSFTLIDDFIEN